MQRVFFIAFFLLGFLSSFSQVVTNDLVIFSEKGERFILYVNDEKVNEQPESNVKTIGLSEGWQKIRIEMDEKKIFEDSIRIRAIEKNDRKEITYRFGKGKNGYELFFVSLADLSGPKTPFIPEEPKDKGPLVDTSVYGRLYKAQAKKVLFFDNYNDTTGTCNFTLSDKEIQYAINFVNKSNDFEDRFRFVENTIRNNCYTTMQLAELLKLLPIEMDKLKMAKVAYSHLADPKNAVLLNEVFKYPTLVDNFNAFLKDEANTQKQIDLKCSVPMSEVEFNTMLSSFKKMENEYDRFKYAKKETILHCISSKQLGLILTCFTHDREKMELARQLLNVIIDKDQLPELQKHFQFSENKTEYLKLIQND